MLNATSFINTSNNIMDYEYVCKLNQYNMLQDVQSYPTKLIYIILAAVILLILYLYIFPLIKNDKIRELSLDMSLGFVLLANITTLIIVYLFTIHPTQEQTNTLIKYIIIGIVLIIIVIYALNWNNVKENIRKIKERFKGGRNGE